MSKSYISANLRRIVRERAAGCCEYCLIDEKHNFLPFEVDHIVSEKHSGQTVKANLAWSCSTCNGYKGSDVGSYDPETKVLTPLFNPRIDSWDEHFSLDGAEIIPKTPVARVTVTILKMNNTERLQDRAGLLKLGVYPCKSSTG